MKGIRKKGLFLAMTAILAWNCPAGAKETVAADKIVVTATRTESMLADVPASVEVISQEDIQRMEGSTVTDLLKFATGINFSSNMVRSTPSIRGMEGRHTLLLIDGKRMAGPLGKFGETDRITMENVERIEIIRGPMSTLYGSEAMGGVINVITKKPEKMSGSVGTKYGRYDGDTDFKQAHFNLNLAGKKMGRFGLNLSGQLLESDPLMTDDQESLSPDKSLKSVDGKLTFQITEALSSTFTMGYADDQVQNDLLSKYLRGSNNDYERIDTSLGLEYSTFTLNAMVRAYHSDYRKEYESRYAQDYTSKGKFHPDGELIDFDSGKRKTTVVEALVSKSVAENHLISLGGELRRELHRSARMNTGVDNFILTREGVTVEGSEAESDNYALFLQDEWNLGDSLLIIPGVRYDDPDDFDSEVSPKLGVTWFMRPNLRLKLNYGHSYVAPNVPQLYKDWYGMGGRAHIVGNKDLKPEVTDSYEIALEGEKNRFTGRLAYFYNDVSDLIDSVYTRDEGPGVKEYIYQNIASAEIQGVEVELGFRITDDLSFKGSYAYLDAIDKDTDARLDQRARNKILARLYYTNPRYDFDINFWGEHTMDYLEDEENYDFTILNLNVKKRLGHGIDVHVGVGNILDKKETEIYDRLLATMFYCGLNLSF